MVRPQVVIDYVGEGGAQNDAVGMLAVPYTLSNIRNTTPVMTAPKTK